MTERDLVAVLGGGNGGHAVAAELALAGFAVNFFELPQFEAGFATVLRTREVTVDGGSGERTARLNLTTTDIRSAVDGAGTIFVVTPAFGHKAMAEACAPHVREGQTVVLLPGTGGSLEFARIFRRRKNTRGVVLAESTTLPFGARLKAPGIVSVFVKALILPLGVFPAKRVTGVVKDLKRFFPAILPARDVLEAAVNNANPIVHPVAALFNAGRIEHSRGDFHLYAEGMTPAVARAFESLNAERTAICRAMGYRLYHWDNLDFQGTSLGETEEECREHILTTSMDACFGAGSIQPGIKMRGPADLKDRYIAEDVPYGMVLLSTLGALVKVPTPTHDAVIRLTSVINRTDYWKTGRSMKQLGLAGMDKKRLKAFLREGR